MEQVPGLNTWRGRHPGKYSLAEGPEDLVYVTEGSVLAHWPQAMGEKQLQESRAKWTVLLEEAL